MALRTFLLVATAVALSAYALHDRWAAGKTAPVAAVQRAIPAKALGLEQRHPLEGVRVDDLRDTIEKPLFDPTRRVRRAPPPPPPPVATAPPPPPPIQQLAEPSVRLIGIISGEGQAIALLSRPGQARAVQVEAGSVVDGWRVEQVGTSGVTIVNDGRRVVLRMSKQR
jgi:hypothetical protein